MPLHLAQAAPTSVVGCTATAMVRMGHAGQILVLLQHSAMMAQAPSCSFLVS